MLIIVTNTKPLTFYQLNVLTKFFWLIKIRTAILMNSQRLVLLAKRVVHLLKSRKSNGIFSFLPYTHSILQQQCVDVGIIVTELEKK